MRFDETAIQAEILWFEMSEMPILLGENQMRYGPVQRMCEKQKQEASVYGSDKNQVNISK